MTIVFQCKGPFLFLCSLPHLPRKNKAIKGGRATLAEMHCIRSNVFKKERREDFINKMKSRFHKRTIFSTPPTPDTDHL